MDRMLAGQTYVSASALCKRQNSEAYQQTTPQQLLDWSVDACWLWMMKV